MQSKSQAIRKRDLVREWPRWQRRLHGEAVKLWPAWVSTFGCCLGFSQSSRDSHIDTQNEKRLQTSPTYILLSWIRYFVFFSFLPPFFVLLLFILVRLVKFLFGRGPYWRSINRQPTRPIGIATMISKVSERSMKTWCFWFNNSPRIFSIQYHKIWQNTSFIVVIFEIIFCSSCVMFPFLNLKSKRLEVNYLFSYLNFWDEAWWFLSLRVFELLFFIVIFTTFRPICHPAFFRCFLSNSGAYTELLTTSFI